MPTITIDRHEFESKLGLKLKEDVLKEKIALFGTDLDKMTTDEIHVEVFPNRPDMLSVDGFIRSFRQFLELDKGLKKYEIKKSEYKLIVDKSVKSVRPFTACAVVKNLNFDDAKIKEIIQLQEKLHLSWGRNRKKVAIGIYPLEKITFPINYKALPAAKVKFAPLGSEKEMTAAKMFSEHETCKQYAKLLDGYDNYPLFMDANDKVLSMPPLINSNDVGCVEIGTNDIFVECSGHSYEVCAKTLNMILATLADMGGVIYSMEITDGKKITSPDFTPQEMKLDVGYVNQITGLQLKQNEVHKLLEYMGHEVKGDTVKVPHYRTDVLHPIDLVEDVIKKYGTNNFEAVIPNVATIGNEVGVETFKRKIARILVGLGLIETKTFDIVNSSNQTDNINCDFDIVRLRNSLTEGYDSMRYHLIPNLLEVYQKNQDKEYPQNIFGIERVYHKDSSAGETGIHEFDKLAVSYCDTSMSFTTIKQGMDYLMSQLNIKGYSVEKLNSPIFLNGRSGKIVIDGQDIGVIGELNPEVLVNFKLEMPVAAFEINIEKLFKKFLE